jgi:hypothetical protein
MFACPPFSSLALRMPCLAIVGLACAGPATAQAQAEQSLCRADEKVLFACTTKARLVSICAARDLAPKAGYVQFRYGSPGSNEMIAWPEARYPRQDVTRGNVYLAGTLGRYLRFTMDQTSFVVFSVDGKSSGLVIEHNKVIQKKIICQQTTVSELKDVPVPLSYVIAVSGLAPD